MSVFLLLSLCAAGSLSCVTFQLSAGRENYYPCQSVSKIALTAEQLAATEPKSLLQWLSGDSVEALAVCNVNRLVDCISYRRQVCRIYVWISQKERICWTVRSLRHIYIIMYRLESSFSPCKCVCPCSLSWGLCRAVDHSHMSYHQVFTCVNSDDDHVCFFLENFKHEHNRSNRGSTSPLCVCPQTVPQRGHVRSPAPILLVSRRLHTRSPLSPNPKALCADNPNQWYALFYMCLRFCVICSLHVLETVHFKFG